MLDIFSSLPFLELATGMTTLLVGALLFGWLKLNNMDLLKDRNVRLMISLMIIGILAVLALLIFASVWRL